MTVNYTVNNPPKFYGILVVLVGLFGLVGLGRVAWDQAVPVLTLIVGYLVGNGVAARNGEVVTPVIGRRLPPPESTE